MVSFGPFGTNVCFNSIEMKIVTMTPTTLFLFWLCKGGIIIRPLFGGCNTLKAL
jgi:hypothetical protein